ncbi:MAG: hypothetical protein ACRDRN_24585, partial [Sciscionella sp.]
SRFTLSFSRRSITSQTLSNTRWAARSLRTKTRRSSAYAEYRIMPIVVVKVLVSGVRSAGWSA